MVVQSGEHQGARKDEPAWARQVNHRCIGCGLCVTTCPTGSLSLLRKPKTEQPYVPKDAVDATIRLGQARGKLNAGKLVGMLVKSKVDRLLAPK